MSEENVKLRAENKRLRDALQEIANNANGLLAGGLGHFSRRDFADAVAHRAKVALESSDEKCEVTR